MTLTLKIVNQFFRTTHRLMIIHHHTKFGKKKIIKNDWAVREILSGHDRHTEKISSGQTFTDILNLRCDLDLEHSNPIFHRTLRLMILYYQTKFGCKLTRNLEHKTEIVIFGLYRPSLWPWQWTQWINFSAWHSGLWWCISVVQKISSGQIFTIFLNLRCDLNLERSNPIFPKEHSG